MLTKTNNLFHNFDFKPNFKHRIIHCDFEIKSSVPQLSNYKPYFHNVIYPFKIVMSSRPYVWYNNKKGKNNIYRYLFSNYKLVSNGEWHLGLEGKYENTFDSSGDENIFKAIISLIAVSIFFIFELLRWIINFIIFKLVSFLNRNNLKDASERYGLDHDFRNIIEKKSDIEGRTIYVKSNIKSYTSYDQLLTSYISYDTDNNIYIEELTISYKGYKGMGKDPADKKIKLVVYPYYENSKKPNWLNNYNLRDDWNNCLIFETMAEERLKYVIVKEDGHIF